MTSLALIATTCAAHGECTLARSDCAAVQLSLRDDENATVVCPAGDRMAPNYALAAGIRNVHDLEASPPIDFEIAYVGSGYAELVGDLNLARWTESCGAMLLFDVVRCSEQHGMLREVECDAGHGARQFVTVRGPLIMVLSANIARPAYVSRYRRHAAAERLTKQQPFPLIETADSVHAHAWNPVRPRVRARRETNHLAIADDRLDSAFSIQSGKQDDSTNVVVADPETCARHLLRYLAHHSFVTRAVADELLELPDVRQQLTESRAAQRGPESVSPSLLVAGIERRPRQPEDSPTRRARQPRPTDAAAQSATKISIGGFMARRPRQADDSSARRSRHPRPAEGV